MARINKALDLNKLFESQAKGKLLKKNLKFPMFGGIKYDGNYTIVVKQAQGLVTYISSGGHVYDNNNPTIFDLHSIPIGVYIAERIVRNGKLGDRKDCALRGPRGQQTAYNHKYMIHDMLTLEEYALGKSDRPYKDRREEIRHLFDVYWVADVLLHSQEEVEEYLKSVVNKGYEGIMLKSPDWLWKDTKSRTIDNCKYKKRPTVDLICIDTTDGEGKYEGLIGALVLEDSQGRRVKVGSGLSDRDRQLDPGLYIDQIFEVEYEQIIDTYIQPTLVGRRPDKSYLDID